MSKSQRTVVRCLVSLALAAALALGADASNAQDRTPLRLTAFAVNLGARRPAAQASIVEIKIERWSTDQERQDLIDTLIEQGEDHLLSALQKTPRVGYIRTPDSLAWDLHYARESVEPDGGRRIVLGTDRRMTFWELANNTRSVDYPFTIVEIHLDRNGKGEGRMSLATKAVAAADHRTIELENYSSQPTLLNNVKVEPK
jgi:hypothetical protein